MRKRPFFVFFSILVAVAAFLVISGISAVTYLKWQSRPRPAHYDAAYAKTNRGTVQVEIPEVYELANIAIAITDYGLNNPNAVMKKGEYYDRVREHFLPIKGHPLISEIEFSGNKLFSRYYGFRENSARYVFEGDRIEPGRLYLKKWAWSPDLFTENVELVEDFARNSRFREFFEENRPFYEEQIEKYKERVPLKRMWDWLERNFAQRYDSYKVIFSPLIDGSHSAQRCEGDGFREVIMFVSGPDAAYRYSGKVREGLLARVVFTEIDHNYVNPTTWDHWFKVGDAFHNVKKWNRQSGYRDPISTFNEYMTWAVFILYARDNYDEREFEEIRRITEDSMVKMRKFVMFKEFTGTLLDLYVNRTHGQTIPELYPDILAWAKNAESKA